MTSETNSSPDARLKSLRVISTKNGTKSLYFGIKSKKGDQRKTLLRRKSNAGPVLNAVIKYCDLFEKVTVRDSTKNTRSFMELTDRAVDELEKSTETMSWTQPLYKPMVGLPPKPWTSFDTGCYHDLRLAAGISLVRRAKNKQKQTIKYQMANELPVFARALNALQATPLSINQPILEAVEWCWGQRQAFGKFPAQDPPEFPRLPEDHDTMDVDLKAAIKEDQRAFFKTRTEIQGTTNVMKQDLRTARELSEYDQFWIPWNLDYRSRFNPVCSFNYHRADHIKALFEFKRGYRIDGNNAYWLKVHVANCGDFEKVSKVPLDQRVQWVEDNKEWLMEIADDYRAHCDRWQSADKPFQFLAAVFEYARLIEEGDAFVGFVPLSLDGTNSGVQHYSGMNRSETEGALVNLKPTDTMSDIYKTNAERVVKILEGKLGNTELKNPKSDDSQTIGHLAQTWLDYGITRSTMKRSVMTYGYSSKAVGMTGQFMEDLMRPLQRDVAYGKLDKHPIAPTEPKHFEAADFIAKIAYASIQDTLPDVAEAMHYLQTYAEALARENKAVRWTSPSGFPVSQDYKKTKRREIKIFLYDRAVNQRIRTKISLREELDQADVNSHVNGISPNFIHSTSSVS